MRDALFYFLFYCISSQPFPGGADNPTYLVSFHTCTEDFNTGWFFINTVVVSRYPKVRTTRLLMYSSGFPYL